MPSDLRLTMIGYKGAGKSCYLLGMYHQLQIGIQGFTLRTPNEEVGRRLEEQWETLDAGGKDRFPPPNPQVFDEYHFDIDYSFAPFMTLDWADYRGGDIDELYQSAHLQELMNWLKQSSCICLAVSGEYLMEDITFRNATARVRVQRMNDLMAQLVRYFQPTHEKPLPVVIVITKYDYCKGKRTKEQLENDIKVLFNPLFARRHRLILKAPSFLTAICPVTLGEDLAGDRVNGTANPQFNQLPIFFAAWATLQQQRAVARKSGQEVPELEGKIALFADRLKHMSIYLEGEPWKWDS